MTASHLGTIETLIPGAQISVKSGEMIYELPKTMPIEAALDPTRHPAIGAILQILGSFTRLSGYQITKEEGEIATVTYRYEGFSIGGAEVDNTIPLYPGRAAGAADIFVSFALDVTVEPVTILRHFTFSPLSSADRRVLSSIIQNGPLDANGNSVRDGLSGDILAATCANLIEDGHTSFLAPSLIWRETYNDAITANASMGALARIGKITTPKGPAPSINGNWLLIGATGDGDSNAPVQSSTLVYQSSIYNDVWNSHLYS